MDRDPVLVSLARALVHERGLANVEIMEADARRTGMPASSFDLVHARTLLINIPDRALVVAEMARPVRPGGWVASMEPDGAGRVYYPPHPALDRLQEIFLATYRQDGADLFIGRRVPELFREAGLTDVVVEARADLYRPATRGGPSVSTWCAACAQRSWSEGSPGSGSWTIWTGLPASIWTTRARWFSRTCSS